MQTRVLRKHTKFYLVYIGLKFFLCARERDNFSFKILENKSWYCRIHFYRRIIYRYFWSNNNWLHYHLPTITKYLPRRFNISCMNWELLYYNLSLLYYLTILLYCTAFFFLLIHLHYSILYYFIFAQNYIYNCLKIACDRISTEP